MVATASDIYNSKKQGLAGFAGRTAVMDDLITASLEKKRKLEEDKMKLSASTDLAMNKRSTEAGLKEALMGQETSAAQQAAMTSREKLTQAGDIALQSLKGSQDKSLQKTSAGYDIASIQEKAKQDRLTNQETFKAQEEQLKTSALLNGLLGTSTDESGSENTLLSDLDVASSHGSTQKKKKTSGYVFKPSGSTLEILD
jgi:hypothetical protein